MHKDVGKGFKLIYPKDLEVARMLEKCETNCVRSCINQP